MQKENIIKIEDSDEPILSGEKKKGKKKGKKIKFFCKIFIVGAIFFIFILLILGLSVEDSLKNVAEPEEQNTNLSEGNLPVISEKENQDFTKNMEEQKIYVIEAKDFKEKLESGDFILIDVRTKAEFSSERIDWETLNIDFRSPSFIEKIGELKREEKYLIYCASGIRSAEAIREMMKISFENLYDLEGGINAWKEAGFPTV